MPRTTPRRLAALVSLAAASALLLAGCSGGDDGKKKTEIAEGPLDKYQSALWDEEDFSNEKWEKQEAERQDLIGVC